jgi:hypothetical protein
MASSAYADRSRASTATAANVEGQWLGPFWTDMSSDDACLNSELQAREDRKVVTVAHQQKEQTFAKQWTAASKEIAKPIAKVSVSQEDTTNVISELRRSEMGRLIRLFCLHFHQVKQERESASFSPILLNGLTKEMSRIARIAIFG